LPKRSLASIRASFNKASNLLDSEPVIIVGVVIFNYLFEILADNGCGILFMSISTRTAGDLWSKLFDCVGKWSMTNVMEQCGEANEVLSPFATGDVVTEIAFKFCP
jgi:hypothetical protein